MSFAVSGPEVSMGPDAQTLLPVPGGCLALPRREGLWCPISICTGHQPLHTGNVLNTSSCLSESLKLSVPPAVSVHRLHFPLEEEPLAFEAMPKCIP